MMLDISDSLNFDAISDRIVLSGVAYFAVNS